MYLPAHFEESDPAVLQALIAEFPLGTLVTYGANGLTADHIPFLVEPARDDRPLSLIGHVARNNPLWHAPTSAIEPMVIFGGASAYISPTWYETKRLTHEVVPTYNYAVVHVHGPLIVHDDAKWTRGMVGKLTRAMESGRATPWKMGDAPQDFLASQIGNIVGIEMTVRSIIGKWKVSQNRIEADRHGAIAGLRAEEQNDMAALIEARLPTS
jgi:transcriptional regulator